MRNYNEALKYSKKNPTELVEFKQWYYNREAHQIGFFLNGKREGVFDYFKSDFLQHRDIYNSKMTCVEHLHFRDDGSISRHFFRQCDKMHGEYKWFYKDGAVSIHCFYNAGKHIKELDCLLNAERDEAFYVTLALYGIDSEYIL